MKRVEVGQAIRPHGLRGEMVVAGVRLTLEEFAALGTVTAVLRDGKERSLTIEAVRPFVQHLLVRFEGFPDRTAAEALHGAVLEVEPARLPPPAEGEVYLFQLVGLPVRTEAGEALGTVADVLTTGAAPILVVRQPQPGEARPRERLLPMSPEILVRVDTAGEGVTVRLLPGMEDL